MEDSNVMAHIKSLTEKEEELYGRENLSDADVKRLHEIKVELDQYWDLLRQRRALRNAGQNPNDAEKRSADIVENYDE
jgi:hypothetical protein